MIPQIQIYDDDRKRIGIVDDAEEFIWQRRWREIGEWFLTINAHKSNADLLIEDGYIGFYLDGQYRLGLIEHPALTTGAKKSDDTWVFHGRDIKQILARRLCQHNLAVGDGFDTQTSVTREAAMRHAVDANCINPTNTDRIISNLLLQADSGRGGTLSDYQLNKKYVGDVVQELCLAGDPDPLGWDVLFTPATSPPTDPGTLTFRVLSPTTKTTVKFATTFQTIKGAKYDHNLMDYRNAALVGGTGSGASRVYRTVTDGTSPTGIKRREIFIDESSYTTNADLDQQGATRLLEYVAAESITADYNETGAFQYITDFDIGDIVTVKIGANLANPLAAMTTTIVGADETYAKGGNTVKLIFGTEKPDLIDIWIRDRKQYLAQVRK